MGELHGTSRKVVLSSGEKNGSCRQSEELTRTHTVTERSGLCTRRRPATDATRPRRVSRTSCVPQLAPHSLHGT